MLGFFDENIVVEGWFAPEVQPLGWFDSILLDTSIVGSPFTLVDSTEFNGDINGGTTATIDTTGATLLIISVHYYAVGGTPTLTDSKTNIWLPLTAYQDAIPDSVVRLYYCISPTVGSGHDFTIGGSGTYSGIRVLAFSSATTPIYDSQNGSNANALTIQPGIINPSNSNNLFVAAATFYADPTPMSIDSSFTIDSYTGNGANSYGAVIAYKVNASSSSENPTFTGTGSSFFSAGAIANFYVTGGGGGGGSISGTSTITLTQSGTIQGNAKIIGTTSITFSQTGAIRGKVPIVGNSTLSINGSATIKAKSRTNATSTLTISQSGQLQANAKVVGSSAITISQAALIRSKANLIGSSTLSLTSSANIGYKAQLVGSSTLTISSSATIKAKTKAIGSATISIQGASTIKANAKIVGTSTITFNTNADLQAKGNTRISGTSTIVFSSTATIRAKAKLIVVGTLNELKQVYTSLSKEEQVNQEIVDYTNKLKSTLK